MFQLRDVSRLLFAGFVFWVTAGIETQMILILTIHYDYEIKHKKPQSHQSNNLLFIQRLISISSHTKQLTQVIILGMSLTELFQRNLKLEMKLLHIVDKKPKNIIKLQPLDQEDYIISHQAIQQWSENNQELYHMILENGMAEFVCNQEYLFNFYRHLNFYHKMLTSIDETSLRFKNLAVLSLVQNKIKTIENIPANCKELYLDFNQISSIKLKDSHKLELLSISHNIVDDQSFNRIIQKFPQLRCVNVSWNRISNLKDFVTNLAFLSKLKVLASYGNPISMLAIYYSYITEHIHLAYIDGQKYVKVEQVKKEEPKVEQKKEVKEQKKDAKKDNKKGAKVEEKPPEEPPKVEPPKQIPKKQLTKQDFEQVRLNIKVSNLEKFTGNLFQASIFPPDTDISKIQTSYWIKYSLFGEEVEQKLKICTFDSATTENDEIRLNLDVNISKTFTVNYENFIKFNQGLKIQVCQVEPKMVKDPETFELKPEIKDNSVVTVASVLGATRIDLRKLHLLKNKEDKLKYVLFSPEAVNSALFYDPFEDQKDLISKKKQAFESKLKKLEQQRLKKLQEQQLLKQQKKGGKDQKKAADKKPPAKKDGKESAPIQKKKSQKCDYAIEQRQYCIVDEQKMFKGKELLCVCIKIE